MVMRFLIERRFKICALITVIHTTIQTMNIWVDWWIDNMVKEWHEKVHTFRLKREEDDEELYKLLESIPKMKKSETIRNMLIFAMNYMNNPEELVRSYSNNSNDSKVVLDELKDLLEQNNILSNEIKEDLLELKSKTFISQETGIRNEDEAQKIADTEDTDTDDNDTSIDNTLDNMFNMFDVKFD